MGFDLAKVAFALASTHEGRVAMTDALAIAMCRQQNKHENEIRTLQG
jgi:hypothetical protein